MALPVVRSDVPTARPEAAAQDQLQADGPSLRPSGARSDASVGARQDASADACPGPLPVADEDAGRSAAHELEFLRQDAAAAVPGPYKQAEDPFAERSSDEAADRCAQARAAWQGLRVSQQPAVLPVVPARLVFPALEPPGRPLAAAEQALRAA